MDDSRDTGPSEIPDEIREQISAEVKEQLEEAEEMGAVAFWLRMAVLVLIVLSLIDWLAFDYTYLATVVRLLVLLLERLVET